MYGTGPLYLTFSLLNSFAITEQFYWHMIKSAKQITCKRCPLNTNLRSGATEFFFPLREESGKNVSMSLPLSRETYRELRRT